MMTYFNCKLLLLPLFFVFAVPDKSQARQQIPFGFFKQVSSTGIPFSESFELGSTPPTGWSNCTASVGGASIALHPTVGSRSLRLEVVYYDMWPIACVEKTIDLTGLNTLNLNISEITSLSSVGLQVKIDGGVIATWNSTGVKSVSISAHAGPAKVLRLELPNLGGFGDQDTLYVDDLNIIP
jgi:hypothetical protein